MKIPQSGLRLDNPAWPLLQALISYSGITSGAGAASGLTLVCADLDNHPTYVGNRVKVLIGGAWGQDKLIRAHAAGGILSVADPFTDATGAVQQITAGTNFVILSNNSLSILDIITLTAAPSINFYEGWQDETGIDPLVWTVTDPATGGAWARGAVGAYLMAVVSPNANENGRLRSNQRWVCVPTVYDTNQILRRFTLEFESYLQLVANVDNTNFFMGLTNAVGATRASNNIIGFGMVGDALQTITDDGGAETVNMGFGETMTDLNKFKIDIYRDSVDFYLNEALIARHITNLPNAPMYLNFYYPTEAGGPSILSLGVIRAWTGDIAR
jgi:hypothetical protein